MNKIISKIISEEATGIQEQGELSFQTKDGKITTKEAREMLYNNKEVAVPAAGAGSYNEVFDLLGFTKVKVIDWTSSAGDWCFGVEDADGWRLTWQENRYPYRGFRYSVDTENHWGYATFEDLAKEVQDENI